MWTNDESAWRPPSQGKNGFGRLLFDPSTKTKKAYIFCANHGWSTVGESPHSTSECKAFKKATKENMSFSNSNPNVISFLKSTADMKESAAIEHRPFPGKAVKVATRWKPNRNKPVMEDPTDTPKATEVVNIEMVNGSKAKLGFGRHKNATFNSILASQPGYIATLLGSLSQDPKCYGPYAEIFYRWMKFNKHILPPNGNPHDDGTVKEKAKERKKGGGAGASKSSSGKGGGASKSSSSEDDHNDGKKKKGGSATKSSSGKGGGASKSSSSEDDHNDGKKKKGRKLSCTAGSSSGTSLKQKRCGKTTGKRKSTSSSDSDEDEDIDGFSEPNQAPQARSFRRTTMTDRKSYVDLSEQDMDDELHDQQSCIPPNHRSKKSKTA